MTDVATVPQEAAAEATTLVDLELREIPLERIRCEEPNVRLEEGSVAELRASFETFGHLSTITVRPIEGSDDYDVLEGHRYFRMCQEVGAERIPTVPCLVKLSLDAQQRVMAQMTLNDPTVRVNFSDRDRAHGVQLALDAGLTEDQILAMAADPRNMRGAIALARLPKPARKLAHEGRLTVTDALAITEVADKDPEAIKPLLQLVRQGEPVVTAAQQIARERTRDRAIAEAKAKLAEQGVTVVDEPQYGVLERIGGVLRRLGNGHNDVHISADRHRGQPCHAACINPHTGAITYLCTDSRRHGGEKGSNIPDPAKRRQERAKVIATNKAKKEATLVRRSTLARLAKSEKKLGAERILDDLTALVLGTIDEPGSWQAADIAGEALGLQPVRGGRFAVASMSEALRQHAAKSAGEARRVALIFLMAKGELEATQDMYGPNSRAAAYLNVLAGHGYRTAQHERRAAGLPEPQAEATPPKVAAAATAEPRVPEVAQAA